MDKLDLLLHPVRIRIVHAMAGGRTRTTADLCGALPDASKASIYRHVALLVAGGVLAVVGEKRVRGAVERRYRLQGPRAAIGRDLAATMSLEDHRAAFTSAVAALLAEFNAYLDRAHADPFADLVGYVQVPLWLNPEELAAALTEVRDILERLAENTPESGRNLYLLSPIVFPIEESTG